MIRVLQLIPDFGLGGVQKGGCVLAQGLRALGCETIVMGLGDGPRRGDLAAMDIATCVVRKEYLRKAVSDWNPDVIHMHSAYVDNDLVRTLNRASKLLVVTPVFGRPPEDSSLLAQIKLCCVGQFTAWRLWRWLGRPTGGIFSVPITPFVEPRGGQSALNKESMRLARSKIGLTENAFVVGRLARRDILKWHPKTEKIVRGLLKANSGITWLSVGMPEACGAQKLKAEFAGRFLDFDPLIDFESIASLLQCLDLHIFASRYGECFSASIVEGMGMGVPCVAICKPLGDSGEIEQITPGETGLLAAGPEALVGCAVELMTRPDYLQHMKEAAWHHARTKWSYLESAGQLLAAYHTWMAGEQTEVEKNADPLRAYEQLHFSRMRTAIGGDIRYQAKCLLARHVYLNYSFFKFGRGAKNIAKFGNTSSEDF